MESANRKIWLSISISRPKEIGDMGESGKKSKENYITCEVLTLLGGETAAG